MRKLLFRTFIVGGFLGPLVVGLIGLQSQLEDRSLSRGIHRLLVRTCSGEVDSRTLLAWCSIALIGTGVGVAAALARAMISLRNGGSVRSRAGRWMAVVMLTGGVPLTEKVVHASPSESMAMVGSTNRSEEHAESDGRAVDSTDVVAFGLGAGSALVGAGMAKRVREIQRRRLRGVEREGQSVHIPDVVEEWPTWRSAENLVQRMTAAVTALAKDEREAQVIQVIIQEAGDFLFEFDRVPKLLEPFERASNRIARLRNGVELGHVDSCAVVPVLIHVGSTLGGSVWINLATTREFSVDDGSPDSEMVWRALTAGVRLGPFSDCVTIVGSQESGEVGAGLVTANSKVGLIAEVASDIGTTLAILEAGIEVPSPINALGLRKGKAGPGDHGLVKYEDGWRLMPSGTAIEPVGMADDEVQRVRQLLGDGHHPVVIREQTAIESICVPHHALPPWTFLAGVMGPPMVSHRTKGPVEFERSKAEELVIWLALHPQQQRRSLARTALWNAAVKDATFSNITAEVRRALAIVEGSSDGDPWLGITMTDELPLNGAVVADSHILKTALDHARSNPEDDGIGSLREGLDLVRGTPFCGSNYIWPDYIGVSSDVAVMIVRASMLMADMCREAGDLEGVYWSTAKGLLALPGHEELVAIRMRAHADHGDFSGVRTEWDAYCRAIAADEWRPSEPAPKLVELWRQLGGRVAT